MDAVCLLLGSNQTLDCVALVGGRQLAHFHCVVQVVDGLGLLLFERLPQGHERHI
jgi:hypothetical protein